MPSIESTPFVSLNLFFCSSLSLPFFTLHTRHLPLPAPASDDGGGLFLRPRGSGGGGGSGALASKPKPAPQRRGGGGGGTPPLEGGGRRSSLDAASSGPPRHHPQQQHERSHSGKHGAGNRPGRPKKGGAGGKWTWLGRDDDDDLDGGLRPNSHGGHGNASGSLGSHGSYNRNGGGAGMRLAARYLDERDPNFSDSEEMTMPPQLGGGGGRTSYALHTDLESRLREYKQGEGDEVFLPF